MENIMNNNATASIKFRDYIKLYPDCLEVLQMETDEQTTNLRKVFTAYFNDYEIGGETPVQFQQFLEDVYWDNHLFYQNYINVYEHKIDFLDGYISTFTEDANTENKNYDLPNKKVESVEGYLSNMDKSNSSHSYTKKGGVNVVDQKFNYLNKLKNVYKEFVEEFKPCFLLVY